MTMISKQPDAQVLACSLDAEELEGRKGSLAGLLGGRLDTRELTRGYAFKLRSDAALLDDLIRWIIPERHCCPFFEFGLEFEPGEGDIWFLIEGPEGVKEMVVAAASPLTSDPCHQP